MPHTEHMTTEALITHLLTTRDRLDDLEAERLMGEWRTKVRAEAVHDAVHQAGTGETR